MSTITEEQVAQEFLELKKVRLDKSQNDREKLMERMRSRHEPFPDGAFEKLSRNNIWETVLKHLDPASLASAHSCCSSLKFLFEEALLIHVFSVLKNKGWLYMKPVQDPDPGRMHGSQWMNNHNIWQLRLVCKSWKRVTEQVHLNKLRDPSWYINYPDPDASITWTHPVFIDKDEGMTRASNALKGSSSDSLSMLCQLFVLGSGTNVKWFHKTHAFLKKYGAQIQGVYIHVTQYVKEPFARYQILLNYLEWMPNLEWLIVNNDYISPSDIIDTDDDDDELQDLQDLIKRFPLPTIHSLTMIQFGGDYENELILNEVMRANPHVKSLQLPRRTHVTEPVQLQMEKLTGLEEYRIRSASLESLTQLTTILRDAKWPLKHLKVGAIYGMGFGSIDELFNLVNRFAPTLETLVWLLHPSKVELDHHRLELPRLKIISFDYYAWQSAIGLDFLLPCRSLEQLHFVDILKADNDGSTTTTGSVLIGYGNTMEESNLWEWFPRLVCLRIEEYVEHNKKETHIPEHYVRKGSDIVKIPSHSNCEINCVKNMNLRKVIHYLS